MNQRCRDEMELGELAQRALERENHQRPQVRELSVRMRVRYAQNIARMRRTLNQARSA